MERNHFDRLSAELITPILMELPNTRSLYSLVRASPKAYHVFLASKKTILVSLMHRMIQPTAFIDALAAAQASQLKDTGANRPAILLFLRKYENQRHKAVEQKGRHYSLPTTIALCQLYRSTQYFIKDLTSRSNFYLRRCRATATFQSHLDFIISQENGSDGERLLDRDHQYDPLSCEEESRLQRAFYRYELYTHIFSSNMEFRGEKLWQLPSNSHFFLDNYQHWEIEELGCIENYLWSNISNSFDWIENSFVGIRLPEPPLDLSTITDLQSYDRSIEMHGTKNQVHSLYVDYLMNLSLPFLHYVLQLDRLQMQREMSSHIFYDNQKRSLSTRLEKYWKLLSRRDSTLIRNYAQSVAGGCQFEDTVDGPNEGWLCVHSSFNSVHPARIQDTTYTLGYVFWDSQRLRSAAFVGPSLFNIDIRCGVQRPALPSYTKTLMLSAYNG